MAREAGIGKSRMVSELASNAAQRREGVRVDQHGEGQGFSPEEFDRQDVVELPQRELMIAVTLLGIPIVGLSGVDLRIS
ncbi:MAG: hypothetical protein KY454_00230 [Actinobacteria bacterium]|nr:hypothetical protein [Actinomycetota bacterium]MBW3648970.1 hypothetical protein [Actinomycetota bacterium]